MSPRPAPAWKVAIEAHDVARWSIEEQVLEVRAVNEIEARVAACRQVHVAAGVAPWKPLLRITYLRCSVLDGSSSVGRPGAASPTRAVSSARPAAASRARSRTAGAGRARR